MADEIYINTGTTIQQPYQGQVVKNAQEPNTRDIQQPYIANSQTPFTYQNRSPFTYQNIVSAQEPNIRAKQSPFTYARQGRTPFTYQHPFTYARQGQTPFTYQVQSPFTYRNPVSAQQPNIRDKQQPYPYIANAQQPNIRDQQVQAPANAQNPYPYIYQVNYQVSYQNPYPVIVQTPYPYITQTPYPFIYQVNYQVSYRHPTPYTYPYIQPYQNPVQQPAQQPVPTVFIDPEPYGGGPIIYQSPSPYQVTIQAITNSHRQSTKLLLMLKNKYLCLAMVHICKFLLSGHRNHTELLFQQVDRQQLISLLLLIRFKVMHRARMYVNKLDNKIGVLKDKHQLRQQDNNQLRELLKQLHR